MMKVAIDARELHIIDDDEARKLFDESVDAIPHNL
jgi:hypothetical protein